MVSLDKILKLVFGRYFEAEIWSRFRRWYLCPVKKISGIQKNDPDTHLEWSRFLCVSLLLQVSRLIFCQMLIKPHKPLIINSWCCYFQIMMYIIGKCPRKQTNKQDKMRALHEEVGIAYMFSNLLFLAYFLKTPANPEWGIICV